MKNLTVPQLLRLLPAQVLHPGEREEFCPLQEGDDVEALSEDLVKIVNVRDTRSDLPRIRNGHDKLEISYGGEARSHFQKMMRKGSCQAGKNRLPSW